MPIAICVAAAMLASTVDVPVQTERLNGARAAMYGAAALDFGSTLYALDRGGRELNPLLGKRPSAGRVLALKAIGVLVNDLAGRYWLRKGRVGRAKFVYWFAASVAFVASVWNFQVIGG